MAEFDDEDEVKVEEITIPKYEISHSDFKIKELEERIIKYAAESLQDTTLDKEIATNLKSKLDKDSDLIKPSNPQNTPNVEEHGVWQCIVGRQFCSSLTFDAEHLIYFKFIELNKYFLCFRS